MITATDLIVKMVSNLDAEGSDRYNFERDFKPAINYAIDFYTAVFNFGFGKNKLSGENLRELTRTRIWQTSKYSRIHFDLADTVEEVWSILVVSPEPVLDPETAPSVNPDPTSSIFIPEPIFVRSKYAASRQTFEEWNDSADNIFMAGNETLLGSFKQYAYKNFTHTKPGEGVIDIVEEIEIRPYLDNQLVAVTYLVRPKQITADTDTILFPKSMQNLLINKALYFISLKQGDGTNLYSTVEKEVATLVRLMS